MLLTKNIAFITLVLGLSQSACSTVVPYDSKVAHSGATKFAPGIVSTKDGFELNSVFNEAGDKVIFTRCGKNFALCTLMQSEYANGEWQPGKALPFSGDYADADPYYTADYSELYFISKRPIVAGGEETETLNFWKVDALKNGWGEPEYLAKFSSDEDDLYPSFNNNGDFYFPTTRNDKRSLYVAKATENGFADPVAIPSSVYGENASVGDSVITRDGNTIIFSIWGREDSKGEGDLYVSHKVDGIWTVAKSLGELVNTAHSEFTPIMSPDGEYLFFTRIENEFGNVYQIHKSLLGLK